MLVALLASCLVALPGLAGAVEAAKAAAGVNHQDSDGAKPSLSSLPGSLQEQNPHNVAVTTIHMVVSSHLDVGCKTPGCGVTRPGEPDRCARVIPNLPKHPGGMGEPWAYHIVNRCKGARTMPTGPCAYVATIATISAVPPSRRPAAPRGVGTICI